MASDSNAPPTFVSFTSELRRFRARTLVPCSKFNGNSRTLHIIQTSSASSRGSLRPQARTCCCLQHPRKTLRTSASGLSQDCADRVSGLVARTWSLAVPLGRVHGGSRRLRDRGAGNPRGTAAPGAPLHSTLGRPEAGPGPGIPPLDAAPALHGTALGAV